MSYRDIVLNANRIMILGNSSSGKSTLAYQLSNLMNIKAYFLDTIYFQPNKFWKPIAFEKFLLKHDLICKKKKWIIEGNYRKTVNHRIAKADLIILIRNNRFVSMYKFVKRLFDSHRHGCPDGCSDKMELSMIKYILWDYPKKDREMLALLKGNPKVIILNSFRDLIDFKKDLQISTIKKNLL